MKGGLRIMTGAGAPTNGTSGTGAGKAGPGSLYLDYTNKTIYQNTNTKASPTWTLGGGDSAAAGIGNMRVAHAIYDFGVDGGAVGAITPVLTAPIPANAILVGGTINVTTAVLSAGSATLAVGTTAGSSATAILGATAKASLTLAALINAVPVFSTPVKMSAAGNINVTVGTAALTAGVVEVFVLYYVAANA